ncbi:DUF4957 domain-containing protein [Desertivirga xinjiangensis]|uniref:DUF4957 domain-containing protein n=1 Tax=Desertivirga xinjiangensis TaxID=539206 RepID=UPI0021093728|nr:DUF4957 domain-containing protein [Pedobacter xinjiangensis]
MNINKVIIAACMFAVSATFTACQDDDLVEIKTLETERLFSPTDLTVNVINKLDARLRWVPVNNAESYTIEFSENADFSGTPVRSIENISKDEIPYTVTGFSGETEYFVRVKAVGKEIAESKWITGSFQTDPEQIFSNVDLEKMAANSVTLNWTPGETASSIVITPGNISHTVTAQEIAAGEATVSGLTGDTEYTAKLMNGNKVRGTRTFTTLIDLNTVTVVLPGEDLASKIANATAGQTFGLVSGTYNVNADAIVSKSISLKGARPTDRPIVKGLTLRLKANAGLTLKDLILDGTGSNGNQAILYDEALNDAYAPLSVRDCEIKNYDKGLMYVSVKALIESVTFRGNVISGIVGNGGDFIDFRNGIAKTLLFENNTVYNSVHARDLFRMDSGGSTNFGSVTSIITIRSNTFNDVSNGTSNRVLYIRLAKHEIHFTKNIIANTNGQYTNSSATTITTMANNNYFNAPNFMGSTSSNAKNDVSPTRTTLDPEFANAAAGDFTIGNEDLKSAGVGDPRWIE